MSENSLVAKIRSDAEAAAAKVTAENEATLAAIERETETKLKALRATHEASLEKKREHLELVAVSRAKQAGKIALQQAKRDRIDAIFDQVTSELTTQSSESYVAFFTKQVKAVVPGGVTATQITVPTNRVSESEEIATQVGFSAAVVPDDSITAGMVIHTADGVYDVTLERLMREQRAELEMEIVRQVNG